MASEEQFAFHNGTFHSDDVGSCAVLRRARPGFKLVRTRDPKILSLCDLRVDVGGVYNPATGDYDHHPPADAGERNGVPYSSFGLIWRDFGLSVCGGNRDVHDIVDRDLVQGVDFRDVKKDEIPEFRPYQRTVADHIKALNPLWNQEVSVDECFEKAVAFMGFVLDMAIAQTAAEISALDYVRDNGKLVANGNILTLPVWCPWQQGVKKYYPSAGYIVFLDPKNGKWCGVKTYSNSPRFPEQWVGKPGRELALHTGVATAEFCNRQRTMVTASDQAGAIRLAELALA